MTLSQQVPEFFSRLWPKALLEIEFTETKATCSNCRRAGPLYRGKYPYRSDLKCCTFHPIIPNYMVGSLLVENKTGASIIRQRILLRDHVLPLGVIPPVRYQLKFNNRAKSDFGQKEELLCPFFDKTQYTCGIWLHRGSVCMSYYCISDYGPAGIRFWASLRRWMSYCEGVLAEECLVQGGWSPREISSMMSWINLRRNQDLPHKEKFIPTEQWKKIWDHYAAHEENFFIKSFHFVCSLDRRKFLNIVGETGKCLEQEVHTLALEARQQKNGFK
ncbi:MAG: hypothetical protein N2578_03925 [Bdellovibrionaceae bacterium]|nr:hypothetical protein [Pseudobdellovibrionaceae bacterium]